VVKLWTIKTNECVNTFEDQHEGKIWAMALTKDTKRLVTGGVDSILNVWQDITSTELDEVSFP
jgi:U3 small nucleolar RNA-associated protein 13